MDLQARIHDFFAVLVGAGRFQNFDDSDESDDPHDLAETQEELGSAGGVRSGVENGSLDGGNVEKQKNGGDQVEEEVEGSEIVFVCEQVDAHFEEEDEEANVGEDVESDICLFSEEHDSEVVYEEDVKSANIGDELKVVVVLQENADF